jgi:hypothetical protein
MTRSTSALTALTTLVVCLAASSASAQRTSVSRQFPVYDNGGKPDLTIDPLRFEKQMEIVDRYFDPVDDQCAFDEFAIAAAGYRRLLRFDTVIMNSGDGDLIVGDRSDPENPYADSFYFAGCHRHYHLEAFSVYELLDLDGGLVVRGTKQGFCMEDSLKYDGGKSNGYDCEFQGITSGWGDWYYKQLPGQWIDITGVPAGRYVVRASINLDGLFDEGEDRYPNVVEVVVDIPDPRRKVAIVD